MTLWIATALTSILLAVLTYLDRWRLDWIPSSTESWLNLTVTAAWACLAALAVFNRPRTKWLFVLLAIHLPYLLANLYILSAHGFPMLPSLPGLLLNQALFFAAITLPAIAVASVVRNFTQFLLALAAVALGLAILNGGGFQSTPSFAIEHHEIRHSIIRLVLALAAIATLLWKSRIIAVVGAIAAFALAASLPARLEYKVNASASPEISLRTAQPADTAFAKNIGGTRRALLLPIAITHIPPDQKFHISKVDVNILSPSMNVRGFIFPSPTDSAAYWLAVQVPPSLLPGRVSLRGTALFDFYRSDMPMPLAQAKHCSSTTIDGRASNRLLKVSCETSNQLQPALVTLHDPSSGQDWREGMNSSRPDSPGPHEVWLSPLFRSQAFFHLIPTATASPGSQWLVPASVVPAAQVQITPEVPTGRASSQFNLIDVVSVP